MDAYAVPAADGVALLQRMIENSSSPVYVKDANLRFVLANPAAAALLGKTPEQMAGTTLSDHVPPQVVEMIEAHDRVVMETGRLERFEETIVTDGETRTYLSVKFPLRDGDVADSRIVSISTDISDLKRAEIELQANERRFRAFIQATSDVVYRMGPDWQEMCNLQGKKFVPDTTTPSGDWVRKYIPVEDQPAVLAAIQEAVRTKSAFELEHRVRQVDGSIGWTFSRAIPILDETGEIVEWFGAARDVTLSKQLEKQAAETQASLRRELHRTAALKEAASAALVLDRREIAHRVLESLRISIGARAGVVYLLDQERRVLQGLSLMGFQPELWHLVDEVPLDENSVSGRSVLNDEVLLLTFDELPASTRLRAELTGETDSRWVSLPVHSADEVIGSVTLVFDPDRYLDDADLSLFRGIADQLGVALTNARLYERERDTARLGAALARIDRQIHSSLDAEDAIRSTLAEGARAIGADSAGIDAIEVSGQRRMTYDWGFRQSIVGEVYTAEQNPHGTMTAQTGETIAVDDAFVDSRVDTATMRALSLRSVVVSPLIARGRPIGALYYNYNDDVHQFTRAEVDFVRKVASSLSLAIENARLYNHERDVSDRLQEALLALPEEIPGIQFASSYHSATEETRVGGDFYDLFSMPHDQIGILIGDVAGKGLNAAVLTSLAKYTIRAHAIEKGAIPGRILRLANEVLFRATPTESFITLFFGVLDCDSGALTYANAGHTTGAIIGANGVRLLPSTAPLLGALDSIEAEQQVAQLDDADCLFLYTDGLTEARRDREFYGEQHLFTLLASMKGSPPDTVVRDVVQDVMAFTDNLLRDDLAILSVKKVGQGLRSRRPKNLGL